MGLRSAGLNMQRSMFAREWRMAATPAGKRSVADPAALLARMPVLAHLPEESIGRLAGGATEMAFERGEAIFQHGTLPTGLYFISSGSVKLIAHGADGRDKIIDLFGPGQMFGEACVFMHSTYRTWTQAIVRTSVIHVRREQVVEAVAQDPVLARWLLSEVSARVQKMVDLICTQSATLAAGRVAAYLLELAESAPSAPRIEFPAPKGAVASLLSLTQETFSRIMRRLCDDRVIAMEGRTIHILDMGALQRIPLQREG